MHISGIESSSVILSPTKYSKRLKCDPYIIPKQNESKMDGVNNWQNYRFIEFEDG